MKLQLLKDRFCVCKLNSLSQFDMQDGIFFLAKTDGEISLVCSQDLVPSEAAAIDRDWRAMRVAGALDFSLVGILAEISGILAKKSIPIFAISTYDTDYILVKEVYFQNAAATLKESGYTVEFV